MFTRFAALGFLCLGLLAVGPPVVIDAAGGTPRPLLVEIEGTVDPSGVITGGGSYQLGSWSNVEGLDVKSHKSAAPIQVVDAPIQLARPRLSETASAVR